MKSRSSQPRNIASVDGGDGGDSKHNRGVDLAQSGRRLRVGTEELVRSAKSRIPNLTIDEVRAAVADGALLVDIRDVRELAKLGTIPGATHVPRGLLEFWADPESHHYKNYFDPDGSVILFCAGGGRSALAADILQFMGYSHVAHLECGFNGWKSAGQPVDDVPRPGVASRSV